MLVIGLTGNIGCGKSRLSKIFMDNSIDVIDADIISREIMNDKYLLNRIFETFGSGIKQEDGALNRNKLGSIVFSDDEKLIKLNSLTHPVIKDKINKKIEEVYKTKNIVIVDAALLIEGKFLDIVDKIIVITCDEETQLERVIKRDKLSKEDALNRINSQMNQSEKVKYADYIIDNSRSIEVLELEANKLINFIKGQYIE
ncbi:MAG: dephospho-CoA kinase [Paraclostridium sp.]